MIDAKVVNKAIRKKLGTVRTVISVKERIGIMKPASYLPGIACLRTRPIRREQSVDVGVQRLYIESRIKYDARLKTSAVI